MEKCTGFEQKHLQPPAPTQHVQPVMTDCRVEGPKQSGKKHQVREVNQAGDHAMGLQPQGPHGSYHPDS